MHECTNRFKTVHASQAIAARGRSPALSYTASTRIIDGVPLRRFNILCCILIAVVVSATLGAIPLTNIERQRFDNMPASGAHLTGREKSVNELNSLPIPFAFIRKHALPLDTDNCIYVFTSASGVTVACQTVFGKMLRVIDREMISKEIDNNVSFWDLAFNEVKETLLN